MKANPFLKKDIGYVIAPKSLSLSYEEGIFASANSILAPGVQYFGGRIGYICANTGELDRSRLKEPLSECLAVHIKSTKLQFGGVGAGKLNVLVQISGGPFDLFSSKSPYRILYDMGHLLAVIGI